MVTKMALASIPAGPFLLDGFPRSVAQAISLSEEFEIEAVIDLNVPFHVIEVNSISVRKKKFLSVGG